MQKTKEHIYREQFKFAILDILIICFILILGSIIYSFIFETIFFDFNSFIIEFTIIFLILLVFINFRKLNVTLYPDFIEARFGLVAKRIVLKDIESISKYKYSFWEFLGWGIRISFSGKVAYNAPGDKFSGILIKYNSKGKLRELFVSLRKPEELFEKLNSAGYQIVTE